MLPVIDKTKLIIELAVHNLLASRWKTVIVGGITGLGALFTVVGAALLGSIDLGMQRSITSSLTGHIQVYSARSKGGLDVMGGEPNPASSPSKTSRRYAGHCWPFLV